MSDLIAAIATGNQLAAIGVIRLSGDGAIATLDKMFLADSGRPLSETADRKLVLGSLYGAERTVIDQCLCTVSRAPNSYTGEETAELQCHGSPVVLRLALEALFSLGARQALPGEFTKRAFLNGRMDLTQAEAVIDLIDAETAAAAKNAAGQLGGAVSKKISAVYDTLADLLSRFRAVVDYPDEDIEESELDDDLHSLDACAATLDALQQSFSRGRVLTAGVPAVILGKPNAGKSSLLNALLGYERAIVTDIPGTTRDTITERVELGGVLLRLTDTAGLRETADAVERIGVERARAAAEEAELALVLVDPTAAEEEDFEILRSVQHVGHIILVLTKADLCPMDGAVISTAGLRVDEVLSVSAKTGHNLRLLSETVAGLFPETAAPAGEILTNARQADAVARALESVYAARDALSLGIAPDAALTEAEAAMQALGELTGKTAREDVTERIFSRFCVGK